MMTDIARKQYILSSCPVCVENMQEHKLAGKYLYTHRELNMGMWHTADGRQVIVLGNAFCTDTAGKRPQEDIAAFAGQDIAEATRYWTGRWTLLTERELLNDAAGLMGVYYAEHENGWVVTSSPALLAQFTEKNSRGTVKPDGISWQIVPGCVVEGGKTLLCTQRLCFADQGLSVAPNHWIQDRHSLSTQEKCKAVADMLVAGAENIHTFCGREILLALTGGKDSRLTFAALIKSGVPFSAYTAQHENISSADKRIPRQLAKKFGISHSYIKAGKTDKSRLWDYIRFTAGNSNGADAQFFARGQFDDLPENAVVIRSGLYEAGQTYGRRIAGADTGSFIKGMTGYYSELANDPVQAEAFSQWLKNAQEDPIDFVDLRDRFYIEQRVGGWAAAIEQSLDMNDFVSIQIANCPELLSVLLSATEQERKELALSYKTMELLAPGVLSFAVNKPSLSDKLLRIKGVLKNPIRKIRNYLNKSK